MKLLKISYDDDLFSDFDYVECPSNIFFKIGWNIIIKENDLLKFGTIISVINNSDNIKPKAKFVNVATKKDREQFSINKMDSLKALSYASSKAISLNLEMHFISSFYTFDRKQLFLIYVSENRIDFRDLAKILAQKYKTRIELRQIGVRDRAKKIGGIGPCGLALCCNKFLTTFSSVSINMAKNQFLALNPSKINGICGRLLCCLNYENEVYSELKKGLPSIGNLVHTDSFFGKVVDVDVFKKSYKVDVKDKGIMEIFIDE